jgi:uncharacterized damage-inducible protein DinB
MSGRVEELAKRFEQANEHVIGAVESCSDEQWRRTCAGEQWSVGVTAHHIGTSYVPIAGIVRALATGQPLPSFTAEMLDAGNAEHARQFANCTREETVELLRSAGREAVAILRGLTDEQLDNGAEIPLLGGRRMTAAEMVEGGMIGHPSGHLQSIRAAF